jgi:hypothetical protein
VYETSVLSGHYNELFSVVVDFSAPTTVVSTLPCLCYVILLNTVVWCTGKKSRDDLSGCLHTFLYIAYYMSRNAGWSLMIFCMSWRSPKILTLHLIVVCNSDGESINLLGGRGISITVRIL